MSRLFWNLAIAATFLLCAAIGWNLKSSPVATFSPPKNQSRVVPSDHAPQNGEGHEGFPFPMRLVDGYGRETLLERPPQRIVSGMLATDEILLDLVPPDRMAAVTYLAPNAAISNCAEAAQQVKATVGSEVEPIMAQRPDLVILARFTPAEVIDLLRDSGTPTFQLSRYETLGDIRANVLTLSEIVGERAKGAQIVRKMDAILASAREKAGQAKSRPRVLYFAPDNFSAGSNTIWDELVQIAGGINVAAEQGLEGYGVISTEIAIALDPEVIVFAGEEPGIAIGDPRSMVLDNPAWQGVKAVKDKRVYVIPSRHLNSISHHVMDAAAELADVLHPSSPPHDDSHGKLPGN